MKPRLYLETTIVSYLTARPSRDLVQAAHQQVTREWWASRDDFTLFISQFVLDEAGAGDGDAAARRLDALRGATLLDITEEAILLASNLVVGGGLPAKARVDALHVAMAAVHGMDFLLTWNCKHIANAATRERIEELCRVDGFEPPVICTPLELPKE
ncbi:type II toxin-antitoxin system VapC family toxin [Sorangium sp. So ce327]|uniref:type II toxin-antitoxin system VapC family toxin n=1 Tax=Sorangium sp. So ce327 TaxID=3133301 RepID=UPI003F60BF87